MTDQSPNPPGRVPHIVQTNGTPRPPRLSGLPPVAGFLDGKDEFFPPGTLPHIPGVTIAWDRLINESERRVRVVFYTGLVLILWWRIVPLTQRQRQHAHDRDDGHPQQPEEFRTDCGRTFPSLVSAVRDGLYVATYYQGGQA